MRIKRIASSNDKFTKGKIYDVIEVTDDGCYKIINDRCRQSIASYHTDYWKMLSEPLLTRSTTESISSTTENKMKKITISKQTLVNGKNIKDYDVTELVALIQQEQDKYDNLITFTFTSKAIDQIKNRHLENIKELVVLLDTHFTGE